MKAIQKHQTEHWMGEKKLVNHLILERLKINCNHFWCLIWVIKLHIKLNFRMFMRPFTNILVYLIRRLEKRSQFQYFHLIFFKYFIEKFLACLKTDFFEFSVYCFLFFFGVSCCKKVHKKYSARDRINYLSLIARSMRS